MFDMLKNVTNSRLKPLVTAIVGGGFSARLHVAAIRASGSEVLGVLSSNAETSATAAAELGIHTSFANLDELLRSPVDVVHVCSPNSTHVSIAEAALNASKHVVCEKPLATTATDARRLVDLAAQRGLVATVPFVYRFHPMVREARELVRNGSVGDALLVQGSYLQDWLLEPSADNWRVDSSLGGISRAFADIGSHLCDITEFVLGDRITRLMATIKTVHEQRATRLDVETEDMAVVLFETLKGTLGTFSVNQVAPGRKNRLAIEVSGSRQSLFFDQEHPDEMWVGKKASSHVIQRDPSILSPDAARLSRLPAGHSLGYQDAFNAFVSDAYQAIRTAAPEGLPQFEDGLRAVQITDAVLTSHHTSSWVSVDEDAPQGEQTKSLRLSAEEMNTQI
jgi:predicted dehydrogenase